MRELLVVGVYDNLVDGGRKRARIRRDHIVQAERGVEIVHRTGKMQTTDTKLKD